VQTGRDATRAYFKGWDERDHHSLILRDAGEAGMDFYGFKVADDATLATLEADLKNYGVTTERVPAGDLLETGERVRFQIPSGHLIELYSQKTDVGNGMGYINPPPWNEAAERGIAPIRMDHALLYGPDIEKVQALFVDVLGFYLVEHILLEDGKTDLAIWLSCSTKAHDIALVRNEEPGKLHHTAFLLDSWEKVLRAADLMSMNRVDRHGAHASRRHAGHHHLCVRQLRQPLRDVLRWLPVVPRLGAAHLDVGRGRPGRLLPRPSAQRGVPLGLHLTGTH
jgi:catechol 2,3-dioxygenase